MTQNTTSNSSGDASTQP